MSLAAANKFRSIRDFPELVDYLGDELDWPIETDDFEEMTFEYSAAELGLDEKTAPKFLEIRRLRPLDKDQPWGIFFIRFDDNKLPVVALRRLLSKLVLKKRSTSNTGDRASWHESDLLLISQTGNLGTQSISFAHFAANPEKTDLPILKVLGWDDDDTGLKIDYVIETLREKLIWPEDPTDSDAWRAQWRDAFTLKNREVIQSSKEMAERLGQLALAVRTRLREVLAIESDEGPIHKLMSVFKENLISDLDTDSFSDMYAQTIAYGLLSARIINPKANTADAAHTQIPITNPFLRDLMETFLNVGGRSHSSGVGLDFDELGINEVVDLLDNTNMEAVLRDFGDRNQKEDPVMHFFEGFLQEYDSKIRKDRGVFYTPQPVVSFIVRSVDEQLRTEFGLADGLADTTTWGELAERTTDLEIPKGTSPDQAFVQILDPATGTGTFPVEVIDLIYKTMTAKWQAQGNREVQIKELWNKYVPKHLLRRLHAFELMMAPYAIAHMKIGLKLYETGYRFQSNERARIYLTNALEPAQDSSGTFAFAISALAHEAAAVNAIKRDQPFTVVIGNPPYSKMSGNLSKAAVALIEPFRSLRGERIIEKGALALELNLQDDYMKFWGYLTSQISKSGIGVGSFITNSRYLSGPTLRGIRGHICDSFSKGFFLDLGGQVSEQKSFREADENVFDIEQGVAIGLIVLHPPETSMTEVSFKRVMGRRKDKYEELSNSLITSHATKISIKPPMFRFFRSDNSFDTEFEAWPSLDKIMPFNSGSIITSRDNLAIDFDYQNLKDKIHRFANSFPGDRSIEEEIGFSVKSKWKVEKCKEEIRQMSNFDDCIKRVLYRPFDSRFIFYLPSLLDTPSRPVCKAIWGQQNLVLLSPAVKTNSAFSHAFISNIPAEKKACSHDRATQMFPVYNAGGDLLGGGSGNIQFLQNELNDETKRLSYIYAILYSPSYRRRYGNALKDSYPRIPRPKSSDLINALSVIGEKLIKIHQLQFSNLETATSRLIGPGDFQVEKISYSDGVVWIDKAKSKGFADVSVEVWNFQIGGYQVCEKWLKDRGPKKGNPGRILTLDDILHYQKVVAALEFTLSSMNEIDAIINAHGGWPSAFIEH